MKFADLDPDKMAELVKTPGYSIVSNQILEDGFPVLFMYRENTVEEEDTGWRFLSGREDQDYLDNPQNSRFIGLNTMANLEKAIMGHLKKPIGTELERSSIDDEFTILKEED